MNCHEAKELLFAGQDRALEASQRAALVGHVAQCSACRRIQDDLAAALNDWKLTSAHVAVPSPEREWHAVRRRIRNGDGIPKGFRLSYLPWLAVPATGIAVLAFTFFTAPADSPQEAGPRPAPRAQVARADSVEVPGQASTMVYVDDKSGWLIVWASDAKEL